MSDADTTQGDGEREDRRLGAGELQRDKGGGKMDRNDGGPHSDTAAR